MGERVPEANQPTVGTYLAVGAAQVAVVVVLVAIVRRSSGVEVAATALISPILALVGLTAVVWLAMVVVRNTTVFLGTTKADYYIDYATDVPREWVERPARTFNNLLQVPMLFYVVSLLMMVTAELDRAQLDLAWLFVALRVLHAAIYIGVNRLEYRFGAWMAGCITLAVLWVRFALAI